MRWLYLWQLRRANKALRKALDALPADWFNDPVANAHLVVTWALAHNRVVDLQKKLEVK